MDLDQKDAYTLGILDGLLMVERQIVQEPGDEIDEALVRSLNYLRAVVEEQRYEEFLKPRFCITQDQRTLKAQDEAAQKMRG